MRDFNPEGFFDLGLIKDGKVWAADLRGKFVGVTRFYVTGISGEVADGAGEVEPGADALVREVVDACLVHPALRDDLVDELRQIRRIGRRSHLVEDHLEHRPFRRELAHRLHEVLAVRGVEPRRAEDLPAAAGGLYRLLALKLRRPVHPVRLDRPVLAARKGDVALENVVRGDVDEVRADFRRHRSQDTRSKVVQQVRHLDVVLGLVHIGVGRAIHDDIDLLRFADQPDGIPVGDVQIDGVHPRKGGDVREDVAVGRSGGDVAHFRSELSVSSRNQYVQHSVLIIFLRPFCMDGAGRPAPVFYPEKRPSGLYLVGAVHQCGQLPDRIFLQLLGRILGLDRPETVAVGAHHPVPAPLQEI